MRFSGAPLRLTTPPTVSRAYTVYFTQASTFA